MRIALLYLALVARTFIGWPETCITVTANYAEQGRTGRALLALVLGFVAWVPASLAVPVIYIRRLLAAIRKNS